MEQVEPINFKEDVMVRIQLLDGSFALNQELVPVIQRTASALGLSSVNDLKEVKDQDFFQIFTPLMNAYYGLK